MLDLQTLQTKYRLKIIEAATRRHLKNVRVFGSITRGEANKNSDIDFIVDFDEGGDLIHLGGFYMDMQNLLKCKVDVVTPNSIHHYIRNAVLEEAIRL